MLKIYNFDIVFQEIPDETTLAVNLSCCPYKCDGCHSPWLQTDVGTQLTTSLLEKLINKYRESITCLCFMGGDGDRDSLYKIARDINIKYKEISLAWYSGNNSIPTDLSVFRYIKIGAYIKDLGGLSSKKTNQRLYKIENGSKLIDISYKFAHKY